MDLKLGCEDVDYDLHKLDSETRRGYFKFKSLETKLQSLAIELERLSKQYDKRVGLGNCILVSKNGLDTDPWRH